MVHRGLGATADHAFHLIPEERASESLTRHMTFTLFFLLKLKASVNIACSAGMNRPSAGTSYPNKFPSSQRHETNPMVEVVSYSDTTSTTVMRKHLTDNHLATWVQGCDQLNISISSSGKMKKDIEDYRQQANIEARGSPETANEKLDQPWTEFSPEAFVDAIMEFIVGNDQVCFNFALRMSLSLHIFLVAQCC